MNFRVLESPVGKCRFGFCAELLPFPGRIGRGDQIKEYSIGVSVYGKPAEYDPKIDATVRGEASRLRGRLLEYYSDEGG